jgi:sensor histidine kinase regulating citrate/malate metabolism
MTEIRLVPKVDETQEFLEIAHDFSNPLELVREAISNAFDAKAEQISISFDVVTEQGEKVLVISITDNGTGMDQAGLQSFFDLGNSLRRGDPDTIGEKGHGTKVYFNSSSIEVITSKSGQTLEAIMLNSLAEFRDAPGHATFVRA